MLYSRVQSARNPISPTLVGTEHETFPQPLLYNLSHYPDGIVAHFFILLFIINLVEYFQPARYNVIVN